MNATAAVGFNTNISFSEITSIGQFTGASSVGATQTSSPTSASSSASITPAGEMLSNLQQLASQSPSSFTSVANEIASQLQAASQAQGAAGNTGISQHLQNLANAFTTAGSTGSVDPVQGQLQSIAMYQASHTYNSGGQPVSSTTSTNGSSLQQLFATISQDVTQALAAPAATATSSVKATGSSA